MHSTSIRNGLRAGALVALGLALAGEAAVAGPAPKTPRKRGFNLLASAEVAMSVNRVYCGVNNLGEVCVGLAGSAVSGGGVWPKGSPDQYIFNSGLQVAGIIPSDAAVTEWAGDTVGAFFFDARGSQGQGEGLTPVYNSLDPADVAAWPNGGIVRDPTLYNSVLIGRPTIAQQDIWVRSWDGNASLLSGRDHPMGVAVDIRGMGWNFPSGNEDILYFLYTFYNITASDPAAYAGLDPAIQGEIAGLGTRFHDEVQSKLNVNIPAGGYRFDSLYAAFAMDPDVGDATSNYSTAILPFNLGIAYKADFLEPDWQFPPEIFGAPFAAAPGFVGVKYLKSPVDPNTNQEVGLTMFSNTVNLDTGFPDPQGVVQLWRYLSGNVNSLLGDNTCNVSGNPKARRLCFLYQVDTDTRFYQSSGPFSLDPGSAATIVVAYVHGAPVARYVAGRIDDAGINAPGEPPSGAEIAADPTLVRGIDSVAGWVSQADTNANGVIDQYEVTTVPRSLLDKAKVAQAVFDNKFLLPFAPEAPPFYLVPGNNQVTVVWSRSSSETTGDPYFAVASNAGDPTLYDPNFRQFDVEGYRIYRGRTSGQLELVAQFDYTGTFFTDFTGNLDYGNQCAPELGVDVGCPVDFLSGESNDVDIQSPFVQVNNGDRVLLADSTVYTVHADSASVSQGFLPLENTGVPFGFIDTGVRNSFTYYYAVTAFDVNSTKSGPGSLESARVTKSTTPRAPSPNEVVASVETAVLDGNGQPLNTTAAFTIDAATGRFSGPPPATNNLTGSFTPFVPALFPATSITGRIDSVMFVSLAEQDCGRFLNGLAACYEVFTSFDRDGQVTHLRNLINPPMWTAFGEAATVANELGPFQVPADVTSSARYGIPQGGATLYANMTGQMYQYIAYSATEGHAGRRTGTGGVPDLGGGPNVSPGGSRWFDGTNETVDHPGAGIRVGHLTGVDTVWAPIHHVDMDPNTAGAQLLPASGAMQCWSYAMGGLSRAADVQVTWGAGGQITSVRDVTHNTDVPFSGRSGANYGFIDDFNGNGRLDWQDFSYLDPISSYLGDIAPLLGLSCGHTDPGPGARGALAQQPVLMPITTDGNLADQGGSNGFGLYIDGERYLFRLTGGATPAQGTVWTLRTYSGYVRATTGAETATPSDYSFLARSRPPFIPGLQVTYTVDKITEVGEETDSLLASVHTVPDPYYVTTALEATTNTKILKFVNLPPKAIIRIYSVSGVLVQVLTHNDPTFGGEETWNLRSRNNQFVASGIYFYHVESASGKTKVGRFTVVNFAQ